MKRCLRHKHEGIGGLIKRPRGHAAVGFYSLVLQPNTMGNRPEPADRSNGGSATCNAAAQTKTQEERMLRNEGQGKTVDKGR